MHNWPVGLKAPGPGFIFKKLEHSITVASNELRHRAIKDPSIDNFVRIMEWSEGPLFPFSTP